ncbi:hypothetical protein AAMO2058_000198100 [Amorphochlora amoebiformis]
MSDRGILQDQISNNAYRTGMPLRPGMHPRHVLQQGSQHGWYTAHAIQHRLNDQQYQNSHLYNIRVVSQSSVSSPRIAMASPTSVASPPSGGCIFDQAHVSHFRNPTPSAKGNTPEVSRRTCRTEL